ncbi:MAG: DedA family protein [Rhodothermales bacterium]|nr:DedA family protein [Rhodothermales bacterium]
MEDVLTNIIGWLEAQPDWAVYAGLFAVSYIENILPPIPGDLLIVFGGYLAATGSLSVVIVTVLAAVGGTLGFMTMYEVGKKLGSRILEERRYRWIPVRRVRRAMKWFSRYGFRLVLANRFLSGLRSVISLTVGIARTAPLQTWVYSAISSFAWVILLVVSGYKLGENWETVREYLSRYGQLTGVLIVIFIIVQVIRYSISVKNQGTDDGGDG